MSEPTLHKPPTSRIQIDPAICHGKPVIRGTRVLISTILGAMSGGDSIKTILEDYPTITEADIRAAFAFAGEACRYEEIPYEAVS